VTLPVIFQPIAECDVEDAVRWYDDQRAGLGDDFILDLEERCAHIAEHPEMYRCLTGSVRRVVLQGFPYVVLYRVFPDSIEILGVMDSRRHPARAKQRAKNLH